MAKIKVIYGSPCSGKTTLVQKLLKDNDIRYDYDAIMQSISNKKMHEHSHNHIPFVISIRELLIKQSSTNENIKNTYIITTKISDKLKSELQGIDGVNYVLNKRTKEECFDFLEKDATRPNKEFWRGKINEWFEWFEEFKKDEAKEVKNMKNLITKGAKVGRLEVTDQELALINNHTIEPLTSEQVFIFKVAICDNEIDRDFEVFPKSSLDKMSKLFNGKTIISNHQNKAENQCARIYNTTVEQLQKTTTTGEPYSRLIAYCYMVKTDSNKDLITEIQAGIKKEVSVGCRMAKAVCSICGTDNREKYCRHWNGRQYDGQTCYFKLLEPLDAYEVSFVAVPAQPNAGVTKNYTGEEKTYQASINSKEQEDLINSELELVKSFVFTEKERGADNE